MAKKKMILYGFLVLVILLAGALYMRDKNEPQLTDQQIKTFFRCDRLTLDARETDVFCSPDVYRNPDLSSKKFKESLSCDIILKRVAEDPRTDTVFYDGKSSLKTSLLCNDKDLLEKSRKNYVTYLQDMKQRYPVYTDSYVE